MKKNQLVILGTLAAIMLLFFMLIYRSSGGFTSLPDTTITLRIQDGIQLPSTYSDSLLELLDLYESSSGTKTFSQSKLIVHKKDGSIIEMAAPVSGMNQLRSVFSSSFYTYEERKADILLLKQNSNQFVSNFRNNANLPAGENAIKITCKKDTSGNYQSVISVNELKRLVQSKIFSGQNNISIYFTSEEVSAPAIEEPSGGTQDPGDVAIQKKGGQDQEDPTEQPESQVICRANDVKTELSFEPGLPNVFSWTEQDGFTYDFTLSCTKGDCSSGLSVSRANVNGGSIEVQASYDEATEKKYTATLIIKCNGKTLKTVTKTVKLVCA